MAVKVIVGGAFEKEPGQRPGLYVRFVERGIAAISLGARSKVGIVKFGSTGTAVPGKVYKIKNLEQANELFGIDNTKDIRNIIIGGASEVVAVLAEENAEAPDQTDWMKALNTLETYDFHVYVNPIGAPSDLVSNSIVWLKQCKIDGKNFIAVFCDADSEGNIAEIKNSATAFKDEYSVFVSGGVVGSDNVNVPADEYACYIAGAIAGTPLDGTLTYKDVPFSDVITRYRSPEIKELLAAGVLVTSVDGDQPMIEQGLTLGDAPFNKIRTVRAKQALIDDIDQAVRDNYIGKITNNEDGQVAIINAIKAYLDTLASGNIIADDFIVELDPNYPSVGADLYILVGVRFLDSIEYIYLTITI